VDCSQTICSADVILKRPVNPDVTEYKLSLEVKDTRGETTIVNTEIQPTEAVGAFKGAPRLIQIPETTPADALIESFIIRENESVFRGINCQLLPSDAVVTEHFSLGSGLPTANKEESRCDLRLEKKLDFETRSSFVLQVVAEVSECLSLSE
jgi:hypothetical protein